MLSGSLHIGTIAGIPIRLHYSWFLIALLITLSLAGQFRLQHADWSGGLTWGVAAGTAVLFFATLLAHELSHAVVAITRNIPVRSITLFALGGVAQIEKDASSARTEFLIAIAGPITSFAIGFACIAAAGALGWAPTADASGVLGSMLGWLGSINVVLATFNLIPGYPLDGGRILRAILWARSGHMERATRQAARVGQVVAGLFIGVGILQAFAGAGFGGLWLAFIGWFLLTAAGAQYAQVTITESLRDVRVGDIMADDCTRVDGATDLRTLVEDVLMRSGRRCVVVEAGGEVTGLVTPGDIRRVDRERWPDVTAEDIMRPLDSLRTVTPDTSATEAFTAMARDDLNQLPVVSRGRLQGIVSRAHIMQLLQSRSELRA